VAGGGLAGVEDAPASAAITGGDDPLIPVARRAVVPASRGFALCWLADNGMLDLQALYDSADPDSFAQVLYQRLLMSEPAGMLGTLALAGDDDRQAWLATQLGVSPAPSAESVLEAIGAHHPARPVAKAARKALYLRRSRAAARHQ
jgi:hypothetical protein